MKKLGKTGIMTSVAGFSELSLKVACSG